MSLLIASDTLLAREDERDEAVLGADRYAGLTDDHRFTIELPPLVENLLNEGIRPRTIELTIRDIVRQANLLSSAVGEVVVGAPLDSFGLLLPAEDRLGDDRPKSRRACAALHSHGGGC